MTQVSRVQKFYSEDLRIRASVAITTELIQEMASLQNTFPLATLGLGRLLTGALLMASQLSDGQSLSIRFHGDGPLGEIFAEANFESEVRAYCLNAQADLPFKNGHLDLASAIGKGHLTVARSLPFQRQPHIGIVPIVSGEIAQDLAFYLQQSHQIPSIMALSVSLDKDGAITAAGGVLIELMPEAPESLIELLEKKVQEAGPLSKRLLAKQSPLDLVKAYAHNSPLVQIEHPHPISYTCRCTMERVERTLLLLGKAALAEMVLKGADVDVSCQFCGRKYTVSIDNLRKLQHSVHT